MIPEAGKTILVVEDNSTVRTWLCQVLRGAGYAVVLKQNGQEALEYLRGNTAPDLIVLDMLMPVLDGWHLVGELRGIGRLTKVPVIIATGTILTPEWAAEHGCAGIVRKPMLPEALLVEIRRCLERQDAAST
jgi:CheY-like chemotaxis protein